MAIKVKQMFQERNYSVIYMALRVCIQGAEVTSFITEDGISVSYSDRDGPNTCSFSLQNSFNAFTLTEKNLDRSLPDTERWRGYFKTGGTSDRFQPMYSEIPKRKIYEYKSIYNFYETDRDGNKTDKTYSFKPGTLILNKHDPIRIFIHNPNKEIMSNGTDEEEWIPFFTGFLEKHTIQNNYLNGATKIQITGNCLKTQLKRMRMSFTQIVQFRDEQINEAVYNSAKSNILYSDMWWDYASNSKDTEHPLAGMPFVEIIMAMLLGKQESLDKPRRGRVGFLKMGEEWRGRDPFNLTKWTYKLDENGAEVISKKYPGQTLERWYRLLQFGNLGSPKDIEGGSYRENLYYTANDVSKIFDETTTYGVYSPWRSKIHFLLPSQEDELTTLLDEITISSRQSRQWKTREEVIREVCELIDFQWITTPCGDLAFEFPMYDYIPDEYGFKWSNTFKVDKFIKEDTLETEAGEIITGLIVTPGIEIREFSNVQGLVEGMYDKVFVKSDILAGKYGINVESYPAPLTRTMTKVKAVEESVDKLARQEKSLKVFALIEFQKRLSRSDQATIGFVYHPYLLPNRNIQYGESEVVTKIKGKEKSDDKKVVKLKEEERTLQTKPNKIGWIASVTYDIALFKEATVSLELKYLRDYSLDKFGIPRYTYIFGGSRMPISFRSGIDDGIETVLQRDHGIHIDHIPADKDKAQTPEEQEQELNSQTGVTPPTKSTGSKSEDQEVIAGAEGI